LRVPDGRHVAPPAIGLLRDEGDIEMGIRRSHRVHPLEEGAVRGKEERTIRVEGLVLDQEWNLMISLGQTSGVLGWISDQVEACQSCVNIGAGHSHGVVMVPKRRGPLVVGVLVERLSWYRRGIRNLDVVGTLGSVAGSVGANMCAVQVGHDGYRPLVRELAFAAAVRHHHAVDTILRRVSPVQSLVYRQKVGQKPTLAVHEIVDPFYLYRPVDGGLY